MATVAVTTSPVTLDSGSSEFVTVTNTGTVDVAVTRGSQSFTLRPGQSRTVYPEGSAVTASVVSGSGQVSTSAQAARLSQVQQYAADPAFTGTYAQVLGLSNGTDDTTWLNAALTSGAGKILRGLAGQTYWISSPLVIQSGTTLDMTGCTVKFTGGAGINPMLVNASRAGATTVMDGAMTSGSAVLTSAGTFQVGQAVLVWGAGTNGTNLATTVSSVGSGNATLAATAATTVTAAPVTIGTRDTYITVRGGTWDRNTVAGDTAQGSGAHSLVFRRADAIRVEGVTVKTTTGKYAINFGDCTRFTVRDIWFATSSDGVHLTGPCTRFTIDNISGATGDDLVSLTGNDFASFNDTYGPISEGHVSRLFPDGAPAAVKLISGTGYLMRGLTFDGIYGRTSGGAVKVWDDGASANTANSDIGGVTIRDLRTKTASSLVELAAANIRDITIDGVTWESGSGTSGTSLNIVNIFKNGGAAASTTLGVLRLRNVTIRAGDYLNIVNVASSATSVARVEVDGVHVPTTSTNTNVIKTAAIPVTTISVRRAFVTLTGTSSLAVLASQTSRIVVEDSEMIGGSEMVFLTTSTNTNTVVRLDNAYTSGGWLVRTAQPAEVTFNGCEFGGTQAILSCTNAAAAISIFGTGVGNIGAKPGLQNASSATVKVYNLTFPCDLSLVTKTASTMATNTNGALACGVGPAVCDGTNWKNTVSGLTY